MARIFDNEGYLLTTAGERTAFNLFEGDGLIDVDRLDTVYASPLFEVLLYRVPMYPSTAKPSYSPE